MRQLPRPHHEPGNPQRLKSRRLFDRWHRQHRRADGLGVATICDPARRVAGIRADVRASKRPIRQSGVGLRRTRQPDLSPAARGPGCLPGDAPTTSLAPTLDNQIAAVTLGCPISMNFQDGGTRHLPPALSPFCSADSAKRGEGEALPASWQHHASDGYPENSHASRWKSTKPHFHPKWWPEGLGDSWVQCASGFGETETKVYDKIFQSGPWVASPDCAALAVLGTSLGDCTQGVAAHCYHLSP